jgi:N-acetylglucosamine-6-phosphate deacetylase
VLVIDAAPPAASTLGRYHLGQQEVELTTDGRVVLANTGRLAGSALRMDRGVENLTRLAGFPLADAVRMATLNPARAGRISGRTAGLVPGERADLVQFRMNGNIEVAAVWIAGKRRY